jgi:hypothetical protein
LLNFKVKWGGHKGYIIVSGSAEFLDLGAKFKGRGKFNFISFLTVNAKRKGLRLPNF